MNWTKDNYKISNADLANVFKYEDKPTTLITWESGDSEPHARLLMDHEWEDWLSHKCHDQPNSDPAVYIILAKSGQPNTPSPWGPSSNGMATTAASNTATRGRRSLRTVPFLKATFRHITDRFCIHGSISAVVNRADVPVFSHDQVQMADSTGQMRQAHVYNCRSSNSWEKDLALTITYLPECQKIYCIMFGCDEVVENDVQKRLFSLGPDIFFPLVMPGILVELERRRHMKVVTKALGSMETKIAELESIHNLVAEGFASRTAEQRSASRRTLWLDTAYLRDGLTTWRAQLENLRSCVADLDNNQEPYDKQGHIALSEHSGDNSPCHAKTRQRMVKRIKAIEEEYTQAILDCTMRLDGMSIATQWAQGETNLSIAIATNHDSKVMRSIAIITMLFLPGTFFAGIFSTSFFSWQGSETGEKSGISSFFWIYVLFTLLFTLLTVGIWWYMVILRPKQRRNIGEVEYQMI